MTVTGTGLRQETVWVGGGEELGRLRAQVHCRVGQQSLNLSDIMRVSPELISEIVRLSLKMRTTQLNCN